MKKSIILSALIITATIAFAQNSDSYSYDITVNTSWSAKNYPSNDGKSSTFTISSGITLSLDDNGVSCYDCSFSGGNITISKNFTCQSCSFSNTSITMSSAELTLQTSTTTFSHVTMTVNGTGELNGTAPISISNSTLTFNNTAELFNNGGALNVTASTLYFNNNAFFLANAGPVNLSANTDIFVGNGLTTSSAYIKMNGPQLNLYDNSGIALGNTNNFYYNWSTYYSATKSASISTTPNTVNCGGSGQNSCSNPMVYGPESITGTGLGSFGVLPVLLTNFEAELTGSTVTLNWTTEQEENSSYFAVERSQDGNVWEVIGTVSAKGNASTASNYEYNDASPVEGMNYYRLKMVNTDNGYSYSGIKVVKTTTTRQISFFPNPATTTVNVTLADHTATSVELMNITGQVLQVIQVTASNGTTISFNVAQYARGMYVVRVINNDGTSQTSKLAVTH